VLEKKSVELFEITVNIFFSVDAFRDFRSFCAQKKILEGVIL